MKRLKTGFLAVLLLIQLNTLTAQEFYRSENLQVYELTNNVFVHTSYLDTEDFGRVACNGMIYLTKEGVYVFDTPTSENVSGELINWIDSAFSKRITAVIVSHFHNDCLGGLESFHEAGIASYANARTIVQAESLKLPVPQRSFDNKLTLGSGKHRVICRYFGPGHTLDNSVFYLPGEKTLFGGCLIKETGAGEGYTADGDPKQWSATVGKIKTSLKQVKFVVPGHGKPGGKELLDYTIALFEPYSK